MHYYTYGLTSDPLIQVSVTFSALIHDVDHTGVHHAVLVAEQDPLMLKYMNKCTDEQRSVDYTWQMLQEDKYRELHGAIYSTKEELDWFHQVLCHVRLYISDKQLEASRKECW